MSVWVRRSGLRQSGDCAMLRHRSPRRGREAAGVPVVATDYSACPELVRGRGELARVLTTVTVGVNLIEHAVVDVADLAGRIEKLYQDPGLVRQYSEAGRAFAESLGWDGLLPRWVEIVRAAAAPRTAR